MWIRRDSFAVAVGLMLVPALVIWPAERARAMPLVDLSAWIVDSEGRVIDDETVRLMVGTDPGGSAAVSLAEEVFARSSATFDSAAIQTYAESLAVEEIPPGMQTNWISKSMMDLSIGVPLGLPAASYLSFYTRAPEEKWAIFYIAPNSASSAGSGADLEYLVAFNPTGGPSQTLLDLQGDLASVVDQLNTGHFFFIDLDGAGVAPGGHFTFAQIASLSLQSEFVGPVTFLLDPVDGTAIPEPAALGLLGIAGLLLRLRSREALRQRL